MVGNRFFKQTIRDIDTERQVVLVRVDYNVPLNKDGTIADDFRIRASLPTLRYLIDSQCKVVLISHLGRPKGRDLKYSLSPVAARLSELLNHSVRFVDECVGDKVYQVVKNSPCGSVIMLENLRFHDQEKANDLEFAKELVKSTTASLFVQDGFGVVHRADASTQAITLCLPSFAGFLIEKEYNMITKTMQNPAKPLVAVIGGAKVSDKIALIKRLIDKADRILIGGAMANTFLAFKSYKMGKSVYEDNLAAELREIYDLASAKVGAESVDDFLVLPTDVAIGQNTDDLNQTRRECAVSKIPEDQMALDIGSDTIAHFTDIIAQARTVIWNGTLGFSTLEVFSYGSARVALAIAMNESVVSIVGGGDTVEFVRSWSDDDNNFSHVSTGGGASIELMAGNKLAGIESLLDAYGI